MNFLKLIGVIALFATIASCSDDTPSTPQVFTIGGDWNLTAFDYDLVTDSTISRTAYDSSTGFPYDSTLRVFNKTTVGTGKNMTMAFMFSETPNDATSSGDFDLDLTETFDGQTKNYEIIDQSFDINGTWSKAGDKIIIQDGTSFVNGFDLVEVTATTLQLKYVYIYSYQEELNNDRKRTVVKTYNHIMTFTK